jgi:hypothetical protein
VNRHAVKIYHYHETLQKPFWAPAAELVQASCPWRIRNRVSTAAVFCPYRNLGRGGMRPPRFYRETQTRRQGEEARLNITFISGALVSCRRLLVVAFGEERSPICEINMGRYLTFTRFKNCWFS